MTDCEEWAEEMRARAELIADLRELGAVELTPAAPVGFAGTPRIVRATAPTDPGPGIPADMQPDHDDHERTE